MGRSIRVVGLDPSLRNWGMVAGFYDLETGVLKLDKAATHCPVLNENKQSRVNSLDLEAAKQHFNTVQEFCKDAQAIFVEVPVGSQSARAMASYGICVGVLGALKSISVPFFEVTPLEVKMSTVGDRKASKEQMINWAREKHPEVQFSTSSAKAEHQADAAGALHAGIKLDAFKQLMKFVT